VDQHYQAYNLIDSTRKKVLNRFPPRFRQVIAHHITQAFGLPEDTPPPKTPHSVRIVGYASDKSLEALVVEIDGSTERPDGRIYHITLSLDPVNRLPKESNALLKWGWEEISPFPIQVQPVLN